MVGTIASRRAGLNLLKIILLLLVPVGLFGYFYAREAEKDIGVLERAKDGVLLANFAAPMLFGKMPDPNPAERKQLLELQDRIFPSKSWLTFDTVVAGQSSIAFGEESRMRLAASYVNDVLTSSGLVLDSDPETHFLVNSILSNLPVAITRLQAIVASIAPPGGERGPLATSRAPRALLPQIGNAEEAMARMVEAFATARAASGDDPAYASMATLIDHLGKDLDKLKSVAVFRADGTEPQRLARLVEDASDTRHVMEEAGELWKRAAFRAADLIDARASALTHTYRILKVIGALSALIAIGYSVLLFHTALRKLDEVERAHTSETTARVEAEAMSAKLAQMNDSMGDLNRDLANNLARLKEAQDELLKKGRMEQLGQLTATIAHELRNPLGAVRTSAFLLERKTQGSGLDVVGQVARINKGIQRCDDIITQLLDFSRLKKVVTRPDNLDRWLARTVESLARQVPEVVQIECVLGLDDREVAFDPARLERAVSNLMYNASEAMVDERGGGHKLIVPHPRITVSTYLADGMACLRVADNGPGIPADQIEKVREPLFTTKSFGTGLGIPAVEQIAVQHDGVLQIESVQGRGAALTICLPLALRLGEAA